MTSTALPSPRSKELYAAYTGRKDPVEAGLQSPESEEYLESPIGQLGLKMWENQFEEPVGAFSATIAAPGLMAAFVGGIMTAIGDAGVIETLVTGTGLAFVGLGAAAMTTTVILEKKAMNALPKSAHKALFRSLKKDLEAVHYDVISSDFKSLSFTTQHGVLTLGENASGGLVMLLNGSPMRVSRAETAKEPVKIPVKESVKVAPRKPSKDAQRFLTSISGEKVPLGRRTQAVSR